MKMSRYGINLVGESSLYGSTSKGDQPKWLVNGKWMKARTIHSNFKKQYLVGQEFCTFKLDRKPLLEFLEENQEELGRAGTILKMQLATYKELF